MTDTYLHIQPLVEMGLKNSLAGLASNCNPPNLSLPSSENYRQEPQVPGSSFLFIVE
jgi:hypothetical protein